MHFTSSIVATLGMASYASAHIKMTTPKPFGASSLTNDPLLGDGSDFPCKQVLFTNSRVVLNIHDAISNVSTNFVDWRRLFSCPEESLRSAYLYQQDHHYALRPLRIEDATGAGVETSDVTIESLTLRLARKIPDELEKLGSKPYFGTNGHRGMGDILEETTAQMRENCLWWRVPMTIQPHRLPRIAEE